MAGYKETPRQKMIGMMYLVLTALLALNVSKDILNAFVIVNQGLRTSQENTASKNELIYSSFEKSMMENPAKVKPYYDKAIKAQTYSKDLSKFITDLRTKIIAYTEFGIKDKATNPEKWTIADTMKVASIESKDSYDKPMEILIGNTEDGANGDAKILKDKLDKFKNDMLSLLDGKDKISAEKSFPINTNDAYSFTEDKMESWIENNFYHTVLVADIALMNKMLIDVKTVEADVISKLFSAVDASSFKFDRIVGKVIAPSSYILLGSEYKANIFLAAYDSKKAPDIFIGDTITHVGEQLDKTKFEDGMGVYSVAGSGVGERKYTGWISMVKPGETTPTLYNFSSSYIVAPPSASVSADKMNVFYIGVTNPVTVSVPGAANEKVHPIISSGGTMVPTGNGHYNVTVTSGCPNSKVTISVMAEMNGKPQAMGSSEFRVREVPTPIPKINKQTGGTISRSVLAASGVIVPEMENFDFELYFKVTSFKFSYLKPGGDIIEKVVNGNSLTEDLKEAVKKLNIGSKVYFEEIRAYGAGSNRTLASMIFKLTN